MFSKYIMQSLCSIQIVSRHIFGNGGQIILYIILWTVDSTTSLLQTTLHTLLRKQIGDTLTQCLTYYCKVRPFRAVKNSALACLKSLGLPQINLHKAVDRRKGLKGEILHATSRTRPDGPHIPCFPFFCALLPQRACGLCSQEKDVLRQTL